VTFNEQLAANFRSQAPVTGVPEPGSLALGALALAAGLRWRRRAAA
jgi:MYXO-CTERM domain-containing protein